LHYFSSNNILLFYFSKKYLMMFGLSGSTEEKRRRSRERVEKIWQVRSGKGLYSLTSYWSIGIGPLLLSCEF